MSYVSLEASFDSLHITPPAAAKRRRTDFVPKSPLTTRIATNDRFIPCRAAMDVNVSHITNAENANENANASPAKEEYKKEVSYG